MHALHSLFLGPECVEFGFDALIDRQVHGPTFASAADGERKPVEVLF